MTAMLEGILLPSNMVAKTTFCLYLVKTFDSYTQMCNKCYHIIFSLKFKFKICVQKKKFIPLKITFWSHDQLWTNSFQEKGAGLKNQITITLFKI